ncbi:MAG: type I restriction enzyme HsdR N-terminal domain-containing protein [Bacteroidota bacterium]
MSLIKKGIRDRFIILDESKNTITYLPHVKTRRYSNPEEKVQLNTFLSLIYDYRYPPERVKVSEEVKIGSSSREADVVVFKDDDCKDPYIVVECKKENISDKVFDGAVDQGFSYAAATNAEFVWATSGDRDAYYEVWDELIHERDKNQLDRIPKFKEENTFFYRLKRRFGKWFRHPILSDTLLYGLIITISTVGLSQVAVVYHDTVMQQLAATFPKQDFDHKVIFQAISVIASILSLLFGMMFMRSHKLFQVRGNKKRLSYTLIGIILFAPVWLVSERLLKDSWWKEYSYQGRDLPILTYLWPYIQSIPFILAAIYVLIWVLRWSRKHFAKQS